MQLDRPELALWKSSALLLGQGYEMFKLQTEPLKEKAAMHLEHIYKNTQFSALVAAFLLKYSERTQYCTTTICQVEQLDENRFQFVRRMENVMSSKPLYEKIIVDRSQMNMQGYTFEQPAKPIYCEHYRYQLTEGIIRYDMMLFKSPGMKAILRRQLHNWGVEKMEKLIKVQ